jgi:hypothetical protein
MSGKMLTGDAKIKLKQLFDEGLKVLHEIDTLQGGLNDTIKAIAEECALKPAVLKKAITVAHKASLTDENAKHDELNEILDVVGHKL